MCAAVVAACDGERCGTVKFILSVNLGERVDEFGLCFKIHEADDCFGVEIVGVCLQVTHPIFQHLQKRKLGACTALRRVALELVGDVLEVFFFIHDDLIYRREYRTFYSKGYNIPKIFFSWGR